MSNWNRGCMPKVPEFHIWNSQFFKINILKLEIHTFLLNFKILKYILTFFKESLLPLVQNYDLIFVTMISFL
jgi:hypothetical protein